MPRRTIPRGFGITNGNVVDMFPRGILDSFVQNDLARETGGRRDPPGWGLGQIMIPLHWIIVCRLPTGPVAQYCFARHLKLGHGDRR